MFDNRVVTRHPFDPIANPLNADVPLIIGTTRTENTVFMMGDAEAFRLDLGGLGSGCARWWASAPVARRWTCTRD